MTKNKLTQMEHLQNLLEKAKAELQAGIQIMRQRGLDEMQVHNFITNKKGVIRSLREELQDETKKLGDVKLDIQGGNYAKEGNSKRD